MGHFGAFGPLPGAPSGAQGRSWRPRRLPSRSPGGQNALSTGLLALETSLSARLPKKRPRQEDRWFGFQVALVTEEMSQVKRPLGNALNQLYTALNMALHKLKKAPNQLKKTEHKVLRELSKALKNALNEGAE